MSTVTCHISMSLDGYVAGPEQSVQDPLGKGGMRLHDWAFPADGERSEVDARVLDEVTRDVGAYVMGRRMFGGGDGPWDESWRGWWGEEPPFHTPVFVLTHHPREPLPMAGGTEYRFVTDGIESALAQARQAAGDREVAVAGGASVVRQYLAAGLLDTLHLHIVPIMLGAGERIFDGVGDPRLEQAAVVAGPTVAHVRYRVLR